MTEEANPQNTSEEEEIELEKSYSTRDVVAKLRRLADALEAGKPFRIQIAGHRVRVPPDALVEFDYERSGDDEEIEIDLKWRRR